MLKQLNIWIILLTISNYAIGQTEAFKDTVAVYLDELQTVTKLNKDLWEQDLYAPILFVRPDTRQVFSNYPDTAGILKKDGSIYSGTLSHDINISNTAIHWSGRHWSMIMLPLPEDKKERINLIGHELFHRAQAQLGFFPNNPDNNHLDQKEGRISLRLELEALKKAMLAVSASEAKENLRNAFIFRKYRYSIYPVADSTENLLELNEGICEYTGAILSGRTHQEMQTHFIGRIDRFQASSTFVRSFAYETIPAYGYLLRATQKYWNQNIDAKTNLTEYFLNAYQIQMPNELKTAVIEIADQYNGQNILAEETAREEKINRVISEYKRKFIDEPHLDIPFENMNMSFDYRIIMPLDSLGTVYPQIQVIDNWGILTVDNGALIDPNWRKITVSNPKEINHNKVKGDGWILELKESYSIKKDKASNNYFLIKQ